jgi:hypothetical protein
MVMQPTPCGFKVWMFRPAVRTLWVDLSDFRVLSSVYPEHSVFPQQQSPWNQIPNAKGLLDYNTYSTDMYSISTSLSTEKDKKLLTAIM